MIKTWIKTTIVTKNEDNIEIFPNETFDGIIVEVEDSDASLHLDKDEMETLIHQMRNVMDYVLKK